MTEQQKEIPPVAEIVEVGDIKLASASIPADKLSSLAIWLLEQKEVKDYLREIELKKKRGGTYVE